MICGESLARRATGWETPNCVLYREITCLISTLYIVREKHGVTVAGVAIDTVSGIEEGYIQRRQKVVATASGTCIAALAILL